MASARGLGGGAARAGAVPRRLVRDTATIRAMIRMFCRGRHGARGRLCGECSELASYARKRLLRCPCGADKPTCSHCKVHCYTPAMRERIRAVMRFSGPRMLLVHPLTALLYFMDTYAASRRCARAR